jgi:hypothetical protein
LNVGISMDEIVHLPGPLVKLRPQEEARLKWVFDAVTLTSVFSGTEVTADATIDSYKRSVAVIRAPDICRSKRFAEQIGQTA